MLQVVGLFAHLWLLFYYDEPVEEKPRIQLPQ